MKKNNLKKNYHKFKELWSIPRYRAVIKLSLYGIMFAIIIAMANLYESIEPNKDNESKKSYAEIVKSTDLNNIDIKYNININNNTYIIEGEIKKGVLIGYIEANSNIKKIKLNNDTIYNVVNNYENIDAELNAILIKEFLLPQKIIDLVTNQTAFIEKQENIAKYTYNINYNDVNYNIKITNNFSAITSITITNELVEYNLEIILK